MKVTDYIVSFLIRQGITDVFGYPGGMVTHLMDSLHKFRNEIHAHVTYHEQGAAFAACGYAQASGKPGVAYATSGPGATNLATGIANAYYDSIPTLFLTGQVNTYEGKGDLSLRQRGFQEMEVASFFSGVTKMSQYIDSAEDIRYYLEKACYLATCGRPGPVVLDIPMNIQRGEIDPESLRGYDRPEDMGMMPTDEACERIVSSLRNAKRPCVLVGAGVRISGMTEEFRELTGRLGIPVVASMPAVDTPSAYYYGMIGAYGVRCANFILSKSDCILSLGSRLDLRQTGVDTKLFATNAKLLRVDVDTDEFARKVKPDEEQIHINLAVLLPSLNLRSKHEAWDYAPWLRVCDEIRELLSAQDAQRPNEVVRQIGELIPDDSVITTDVGQNQVWVAQSFPARGRKILFSGGHGAMGYSLPAAIGAHYASGKRVFAFTGDGGLQMNLQELQFLARENISVKIILLNNHSLGMIRHFQEMYFSGSYVQTIRRGGYSVPDFERLSTAFGLPYVRVKREAGIKEITDLLLSEGSGFIEVMLEDMTYVYPKLAMGKVNQDQDPALDRELYQYIEDL